MSSSYREWGRLSTFEKIGGLQCLQEVICDLENGSIYDVDGESAICERQVWDFGGNATLLRAALDEATSAGILDEYTVESGLPVVRYMRAWRLPK